MSKLTLQVNARHFKNSLFHNRNRCALALAAQEQFNTEDCYEEVNKLIIDKKTYMHSPFRSSMYNEWRSVAKGFEFDNTGMFEIDLTLISNRL